MHASVKRVVLIVNPFATRVTDERVDRVATALGEPPRCDGTPNAPGHATELAREAAGDGRGDLRLLGRRRLQRGPERRSTAAAVGFVPGGGASVLPRALGLPRDPVAAATQIAARSRPAGRGASRSAASTAGASRSPPGSASTRKSCAGWTRSAATRTGGGQAIVAFAREVLALLAASGGRFEPALEIKGLGRAAFAVVANATRTPTPARSRCTSRRRRASRRASTSSRRDRVRARTIAALLRAAAARRSGVDPEHPLRARSRSIEIVCDRPLPLQADGEDLGDVSDALSSSAERDAVAVLV